MTLPLGFNRDGAILSPCRRYRYRLSRAWGSFEHRCAFLMVNPSTADETWDDPTVRKCVGFARRWGFGALDVVNLFAWRSTDVTALLTVEDPVGPDNDEHVIRALDEAHRVVFAWGKHNKRVSALVSRRYEQLVTGTAWRPPLEVTGTLGRNGDGSPRHPLMLAYTTRFEPVVRP